MKGAESAHGSEDENRSCWGFCGMSICNAHCLLVTYHLTSKFINRISWPWPGELSIAPGAFCSEDPEVLTILCCSSPSGPLCGPLCVCVCKNAHIGQKKWENLDKVEKVEQTPLASKCLSFFLTLCLTSPILGVLLWASTAVYASLGHSFCSSTVLPWPPPCASTGKNFGELTLLN